QGGAAVAPAPRQGAERKMRRRCVGLQFRRARVPCTRQVELTKRFTRRAEEQFAVVAQQLVARRLQRLRQLARRLRRFSEEQQYAPEVQASFAELRLHRDDTPQKTLSVLELPAVGLEIECDAGRDNYSLDGVLDEWSR